MTFVLGGLRLSGNNLQRNALTLNESAHALQALFPLRRRLLPVRGLLRKSCSPGLPHLLLPSLQEGRLRGGGGGLGVHLVLCPVRLPLLLLDLSPVRGVTRLVRASAPLSPQLLRELGRGRLLIRSGRHLPAPLPRLPLPAHHSTLCDVVSRESFLWSAPVLDPPVFPDLRVEEQGRIAEPALGRTALVTAPVVLALALLTTSSRERRRWESSRSLSSCERSQRDRSRSSDRSRLRRVRSRSWGDRSRRDRSRSSDCYRSCRQRSRSPARRGGRRDRSRSRDPPCHSRDRLQSRVRSPPSSDRSRSKEGGRRARRERQESVETVAVFQAPVVSEASATVAPPVGATVAALPSAVQDLSRFFLSLAGSSSLGAVGGVAGAAAPASGVGAQLCLSALGGGAVAFCAATAMPAGAVHSPAASAAVPVSSGRQQCQEVSCSSRCRRRSSSDGTGRMKKKCTRDRSPSPGRSSRHREKSYRSSSESSEDDRAAASPPISGRAPGGTPGDSRPASAGDRSPRPGPLGWRLRSSAGAERCRSGFGGRLSPAPSGDALDIDRDDSFRSVLALIQNFHSMEEPAGVPSARCKTSLASIYGLMLETSLAFHLPTSPLMQSLLVDTNLALSKFLEDQTVHGFLPVPSRRHRRYYRTSSSSFPGPYSVPPGVTSITLEKASETRIRSVSLSAS